MKVPTGIRELDAILNGGFEKGTLSLILAEGDFSGKTTTLSYLANQSADIGNKVMFVSFDEETTELKPRMPNQLIKVASLAATNFEEVQTRIAALSRQADVVFLDNLNRLDLFNYNPEAVSVIHNLKLLTRMWNVPIVASIGVLPEHDVIPFLRLADNAFDIDEFYNKTFNLGVLKNSQGEAGFSLNFGVAH